MQNTTSYPARSLRSDSLPGLYGNSSEDEQINQLFLLSEKISLANSVTELVKYAEQPLLRLLKLESFAIILWDDNRKCSTFYSEENNFVSNGFEGACSQSKIFSDLFLDRIVRLAEFQLFEPGEVAKGVDARAMKNPWYSKAAERVFGMPLIRGKEVLGFILMETQSTETICSAHSGLTSLISSQLSMSISRIYATNDINRRVRERQLFYSLVSSIGTVKNTTELLEILNENLKPMLGFSHTLIGTINDDGVTCSAFLLDPNSPSKDHPGYSSAKSQKYPIKDGFLDKCISQADPVLFDLHDHEFNNETPFYIKVNFEKGISHVAMSRFCKHNNVFGFWIVFFPEGFRPSPASLRIIEGVASLISIAVSNLKATEEIRLREKEKSMLLEFSFNLACYTKRVALEKVIKLQLTELFGISNFALHALSDNGKSHRAVLTDPVADFSKYELLESLNTAVIETEDSVFRNAILSGENDVISIGRPKNPESASLSELFKAPLSLFAIPLRIESEVIGILSFTEGKQKLDFLDGTLFRGICSQIAVTLANLEAKEKIKIQLREVSRSNVQLEDEKTYLQEEIETFKNSFEVVGASQEMSQVFKLVSLVAPSISTVLLLGETGTGKELIARAIHNSSPRRDQLMVKVNCAALPVNLIESELFGHERGSFTGATERRIGKFELANNGTLFLDEIGEMPLDLQVKLLRALQEREIERIGGKGTIKVNVRVIAATNRDLEKEMEAGKFRSDLFYRLNIFPINLPALRERKSDIPELANFFMSRFAKRCGKKINEISKRAMQDLMDYSWPGNIRELEHQLERTVLLTNDNVIREFHLPTKKQLKNFETVTNGFDMSTLEENERKHILSILTHCNGRIAGDNGAASVLGIPSSTLSSRMKKLGIKRQHQG
ncbi:sigma 54-interacting transcriptional regulator [Pedobacter sp. Leaf194]|uniref:sigma-54-dependent Fis family transcriptional regulator n=1 Tax=Pedobacter sp. Leaf194 TaxID=1736297 RepID=UPI000A5F7029|nr:sigma 54-interacting transcriptional regulator [Pedobacter sp. Leaf194]